ncbi:TonB-dependent Receptor Plug Domain [Sphingomonas gellani]|uniref:TonB-dependent Receptor Plug Domain n=1 Tax=Sphingomonas gellani TaxID=1166340 RepID=A0A1H7YMB2_9SPHN|nr:TonB-dependent receptor [Sphingomonas gellani]SEM47071.1 TonB-dependent Receptor Plug Domain [Sphingomonas gellani]
MNLNRLASATALATTLFLSPAAWAQTASDPQTTAGSQDVGTAPAEASPTQTASDEQDGGGEVVVTGSRIRRTEADSAVPVTVVNDREIQATGLSNVGDILRQLPSVGLGSTRTNTNFLTSGTGISALDLRALGSSRTLTLVNGRRFIGGFAGDSSVDTNNIPTDFVERIDVVTGGNSAVYGSDAVAGVINYVLRDHIDGITVRAQNGVTERGDGTNHMVSVTAGTALGHDDRGNVMVNYTWDKDNGLFSRNRSISAQDCANLICGPASYSTYAAQGRFQLLGGDDLTARAILPGRNSIFTFNPDNSVVNGFPVGYGYNRNNDRYISTPVERQLVSGVANYKVSDSVTAFVEATYSHVKSNASLEPSALGNADIGVDGIGIDNPFIPASVAAAIAAANSDANPDNDVSTIGFRRRSNGIFDRSNRVSRDTWRVATGLKGDLGKFNWDATYVFGHLRDFNSTEDVDITRYANALNAIRVGPGNVVGTDIICRDVAARAQGCIPLNLFGYNTVDPRAASYVQAVVPKSEDIRNTEHVVTASIGGPLASLWAGDVQAVIGGEYRKEKTNDDLDILTNTGQNSGNQVSDLVGSFDVKEVFGELSIPLLRDMSFTRYFGLNGAARYSDYSTIGHVFSWNAGAEWEVLKGLRFRGNYAVANRAPNTSELFSTPSETFAAVADPCDGITASDSSATAVACRRIAPIGAFFAANPNGTFQYSLSDLQSINGFTGGNTALKEETGKTYTLGVTYTPAYIPGLLFTADYYNIKIEDAISTIGRSRSIQQCLLTGAPVYCDNVYRSATTGFVTRVDGQLINTSTYKTSGIDFVLRYNRDLNLLGPDSLALDFRYTHLFHYITQGDPSDEAVDYAGTFGYGFSRDRFNVRATYSLDDVSFSWQTQFLSGGPYTLNFASNDPAVQALNNVKDYWLHNAQLRWDIDKRFSFYVNVDNVLDKKPQYLPGAPFGTPTGLETAADFDLYGRRYTMGVKVAF